MVNFVYSRKWGSFGTGDKQFDRPHGVDVYKDEVFVADEFNKRIQVFTLDGIFKREWPVGHFPRGICVYKDELFVAMRDDHPNDGGRLMVYSLTGTLLRERGLVGASPGNQANGVDVYKDEVFVTYNSERGAILVFSLDLITIIHHWWIARRSRGIKVYNDEVYISEVSFIKVYSLSGSHLRTLGSRGSGDGQFNDPSGIDILEDRVFVADRDNHRVQVLALDGTFINKWGSFGTGNGQFDRPKGIVVYNNEAYVIDSNNHRIQVFWEIGFLTGKLTFSGNLNWARTRFKALTGTLTFAGRLRRKVSWKRVLIGKLRPVGRTFVKEPTWREDMPTETEAEETQIGERR